MHGSSARSFSPEKQALKAAEHWRWCKYLLRLGGGKHLDKHVNRHPAHASKRSGAAGAPYNLMALSVFWQRIHFVASLLRTNNRTAYDVRAQGVGRGGVSVCRRTAIKSIKHCECDCLLLPLSLSYRCSGDTIRRTV